MNSDIDQFNHVILEMLETINELKVTKYEENFKISLMYNFFDLLSKSAYGDLKINHRTKFIKYIDNFSNWKYKDHISLPQISLSLINYNAPEFEDLKNVVNYLLNKWAPSRPIKLDNDHDISELQKYWPMHTKINSKFTLDYFTHKNLLYNLRNSIVHEMRPLGRNFALFDEYEPHYVSRGVLKKDKQTNAYIAIEHEMWELNYPYQFYYNLANESIPKLIQYFLENNINPYTNFNFSSSWVY